MFIIDKYILRRCIAPFLYCFASFVLLAILVDLFEHGDDMIEHAMPLKILGIYYFYYVGAALPHITPMAVLLASLHIISSFIRHNELTAMQSGGIHLARFLFPFIFVSFIISLLLIVVNESIATKSMNRISVIKSDYLFGGREDTRYKNLAKISDDNKMVLIKQYLPETQEMNNPVVLVFGKDDFQLLTRTNADKAIWKENGWMAHKVLVISYDDTGGILKQESFDQKRLNISEKPEYFRRGRKSPQEMSYPDLKRYIRKLEKSQYPTSDYKIDLFNKIAVPFASFFVILLGIPCAFLTRHSGVLVNFAISIALGLGYVLLYASCMAFGRVGFINPFLASWLTNFVFGSLGLVLFTRKT